VSAPAPFALTCAQARDRFAAYLDERLGREERHAVRRHLEACDPCRREAAEQDPAFAFAFLGGGSAVQVSPEETAAILASVRTGIELKKAERRIGGMAGGAGSGRIRVAVSVAAAALVAAVIATSGSSRAPRPEPVEPAKIAQAPAAAAPASPASEFPEPTGPLSPFAEARGPAKSQKLPADATIYDWNPGGGQPRVVWIVDRSLDI
jgi:anti-sigma factor RsiW